MLYKSTFYLLTYCEALSCRRISFCLNPADYEVKILLAELLDMGGRKLDSETKAITSCEFWAF